MTWTPWHFMLVAIAGWMNRQQQDVIAYLTEENRILREKLGHKRIILNDAQKRRLATAAMKVGRDLLRQCGTLFHNLPVPGRDDLCRSRTSTCWNNAPLHGTPGPLQGPNRAPRGVHFPCRLPSLISRSGVELPRRWMAVVGRRPSGKPRLTTPKGVIHDDAELHDASHDAADAGQRQ